MNIRFYCNYRDKKMWEKTDNQFDLKDRLVYDWVLNCSLNEIISTRFQRSMHFVSWKENTVIPLTVNCLSVGLRSINSPLCVPVRWYLHATLFFSIIISSKIILISGNAFHRRLMNCLKSSLFSGRFGGKPWIIKESS